MAHKNERLFWIDLEMTGLNPDNDHILEIASIVTDNNLVVLAHGPNLVIHQSEQHLSVMNAWCLNQHTQSGLLDRVRASTTTLDDAQKQTLEFFAHWCPKDSSPLCGNTVYQDRAFLRTHMPSIDQYAHYRVIDVSSVKELVLRWYGVTAEFKKNKNHRALDDILESIQELEFYRSKFFIL